VSCSLIKTSRAISPQHVVHDNLSQLENVCRAELTRT
jgi:hypothetical protein